MKFGVALFGLYGFKADPSLYPAVAIKAEELGFESVWIGDHVVFPASFVREGGDREWHSLLTADMDRPDPFITLSYMAAVTKRLRFGQNVYLLPLRRPLVTARTVGTLDWLSALVELDDAPNVRLTTNIVECPLERIHIGMPVEAVFKKVNDDLTMPYFRPAR